MLMVIIAQKQINKENTTWGALKLVRNSELSVFKTGGNISIIRILAAFAAGRDKLKDSYIALW